MQRIDSRNIIISLLKRDQRKNVTILEPLAEPEAGKMGMASAVGRAYNRGLGAKLKAFWQSCS